MQHQDRTTITRLIPGGGEMGEIIRAFDWSGSTLGEPETWPTSLTTTLNLMLNSAFPMFLFWGPDLISFYNDAYRPSLGAKGKHPGIGRKGKELWPEIWDFIGPLIDKVMSTGQGVWFEDQLLPIYRNGKMEDVYWTFSYSPAYNGEGAIYGVFVVCSETTVKVQQDRMLRRQEENLRNTILKAPVAMSIFKGPDHVVEVANERILALWGKTAPEVLNKPIFKAVPEARDQGLEELLHGVFHTGNAYHAEAAPVRLLRDGKATTVYLDFAYEPYRERDGTVTGVIAVATDVTGQVVSRRKLEESEKRFRQLVQNAAFPIAVYAGVDMLVEVANPSIISIWGKGDDVIGKKFVDVLPELAGHKMVQQLRHVFTTGEPLHVQNERYELVVDGQPRTYYFNFSITAIHDADGKIYGVMNTAADVTDVNMAKQRVEQSERNFKNMILQAPVAMCLLRGETHVVDIANDLIVELWGKPRAAMANKPIFEGLPEAREQGLERLLHDVYHHGVTVHANERPVQLLRNGIMEVLYLNFVYEPYREADGSVAGVLAIAVEVTDQVTARQQIEEVVEERTRELATANSELQQTNAELAQFAYIASHDLQEPVRKVSTFTQMLESHLGVVDERARRYLEKIKSSSVRMLALIRDVLAYSEVSQARRDYLPVDLEQVVREVRTDFELLIEQKGARVRCENLPVIDAIPLQMVQLFSNLIYNALKFASSKRTPEIVVRGSRLRPAEEHADFPSLPDDGEYYSIAVIDNGIGFSQQYAEQIFNIFQRLHARHEYEGTGIGLAMCKKIVQNHHGEIFAKSVDGKGSTFVVILPARQESAP